MSTLPPVKRSLRELYIRVYQLYSQGAIKAGLLTEQWAVDNGVKETPAADLEQSTAETNSNREALVLQWPRRAGAITTAKQQ